SGANSMKSKISFLSAFAAAAFVSAATLSLGQDHDAAPTKPAQPPAADSKVTILSLKRAEASTTADQLKQLLSGKDLKIIADTRTNQVLLSGSAKDIEMAEMLAKSLDDTETQQQPFAWRRFAPANPFGVAAGGNDGAERARLDEQIANAQKRAD